MVASSLKRATKPPKIIAVTNQKGGVGKTTTAINLATAMAAVNRRVLVIDLDPQGNASTGLGFDRKEGHNSSYQLLIGEAKLQSVITKTAIPNLDLIPSGVHLAGAEVELVDLKRREYYLKSALDSLDDSYQYVLIDCPPALGLLTVNALVAAQFILVPLQCEFFALEGISQLIKTIEKVKRIFNPTLEILGIVLTMYDNRNNLSAMVAADARDFFGDKVYNTVIPRNVRVSEAPSHGKPVLLYDLKCTGSQAYLKLAQELLKRERKALA